MSAIPGRIGAGRLVRLGHDDAGVLPVADPDRLSDYQLCCWYAREIERRQTAYASLFQGRGLAAFRIGMRDLTRWERFLHLATFAAGPSPMLDEATFRTVTARNQNLQAFVSGGIADRPLPPDMEA